MKPVSGTEGAFLQAMPFFSGLPEEDMSGFVKSAIPRNYKKSEYIYHQGDDADRFFIILDGWVRLYRETVDGEEGACDLLTRGDIFGEGLIFYRRNNHIFSAQVVEHAYILEISKSTLRYRAEENPDILKRIMGTLCEKMIKLQAENERLANMSAPQRAACLLLRLSANMVGNGGTLTFPYDKSIAAAQMGMKRETFSRALVSLKSFGVTVNGSEITIESFKRLAEYSCRECTLSYEQCAGARFSPCEPYNLPLHNTTYSHNFHGS